MGRLVGNAKFCRLAQHAEIIIRVRKGVRHFLVAQLDRGRALAKFPLEGNQQAAEFHHLVAARPIEDGGFEPQSGRVAADRLPQADRVILHLSRTQRSQGDFVSLQLEPGAFDGYNDPLLGQEYGIGLIGIDILLGFRKNGEDSFAAVDIHFQIAGCPHLEDIVDQELVAPLGQLL